jgi:hypothetical protein
MIACDRPEAFSSFLAGRSRACIIDPSEAVCACGHRPAQTAVLFLREITVWAGQKISKTLMAGQ